MDTVKVHYTGRLEDGTVFDQSPEERPLQFIIGREEVIAGFDEAVEGMYQGESKNVTVPCAKAYGKSKPELIEIVERSVLADKVDLQVGGQLEITNHDNTTFRLMVREITESHVTLDANHPLADKDLTFDIELLEVKKPQQQPPGS
ncbi:MAG: peptidylprolyl isomerase [Desulfuromonadales bacterium]|jgi:peptidylprolyl isomerase